MALDISYIAGFFDGEGSVSIVRNRVNGQSDYHKIVVSLTQRAKHRQVLDEIADEFGGTVFLRNQQTRISKAWAEQAVWQLQARDDVEWFLGMIQPYVIVKATQVELGLDFVETFQASPNLRDDLGRIRGRSLSIDEIERREQIRLAMRDANELGPPHVKPSTLPPLDLRHRQRDGESLEVDRSTILHGEQLYNAKLTDDTVREIREQYKTGTISQEALATRYGVSLMLINGVVRGTRWAHVT